MTEPPGILLRSGEPFATGACGYLDAYPDSEESMARIYVRIQPQGTTLELLALLDTGAHYCLLNEDAARVTRGHLTMPLGEVALRTAHGPLRGELYIHRIRLIVEEGEPLDIDSTVFLPPGWRGPSILGYTGVMDRMRVALDPEINCVYYGPLG